MSNHTHSIFIRREVANFTWMWLCGSNGQIDKTADEKKPEKFTSYLQDSVYYKGLLDSYNLSSNHQKQWPKNIK